MSPHDADAVVIGAGHHGLVAANVLVDHGWDVLVLEGAPQPGGAVRTGQLTVPGFHHDLFSAFYPLGAASPVLSSLHLEDHGLRWLRAPLVLANPTPDGPTAVLSTDPEVTAASLDQFHPGDGNAWRRLYEQWQALDPYFVKTLLSPFPPLRPALEVLRRLIGAGGTIEVLRFARFAMLPVRRMAEERFGGEGAALILGGNAMHADLLPESAVSGVYGWLLAMLGQQVGFPVPAGGAGKITDALMSRLTKGGGVVRCGERVTEVVVSNGRATGVRTAGGELIRAKRAVLADISAPDLYLKLLRPSDLPPRVLEDMASFEWDTSTFKVDWALSSPVPWTSPECRRAGTVHLGDSLDHLSEVAHALATRHLPARPYSIIGQQSMTDPSRMPAGGETVWAYAHVPREIVRDDGPDGLTGNWEGGDAHVFAARLEAGIEARAPGFSSRVLGRHIFTPASMEAIDAGLNSGAVAGGTAQLHQELIFRPIPGLARSETPVKGLYLASASAHPGGGVHGACGNNAARAALLHARFDPRLLASRRRE